MDALDQAQQHAAIEFIKSHPKPGIYKVGKGAIKLSITDFITSAQYELRHLNEIGKYTMLQFVEIRAGQVAKYKVIYK